MADFHLWATYGIVLATIIVYASDRYPIDLVAVASLVAVLAVFSVLPFTAATGTVLTIDDLLAGFANPALITVLALLIVGQGLFATDAMNGPARALSRLAGSSAQRTIIAALVTAAVLSAFLNNTPVVVIFIPILTVLAAQRKFSLSKVLMPLSFLSILGGMTTLIGSSTNLLVAGVAAKSGSDIGFFSITPLGLLLAFVGGLYVLFVMPRILGASARGVSDEQRAAGTQFVGDIRVTSGHPFEGMTSKGGLFPGLRELSPRLIIHRGASVLPPFEDVVIEPGDTVVVSGTRSAFINALSRGSGSTTRDQNDTTEAVDDLPPGPDYQVAEVVVAPGSRHVGRLVRNSSIETASGVAIIAIQRKSRMGRSRMSEIRLEPGDILLVGGTDKQLLTLRGDHDLLLLEGSSEAVPQRRKAGIAGFIFFALVVIAATGLMPIAAVSIIAAFLMVATGCLTLMQASRAFDRQIFLLVGASIAAATALEVTGGASLIAKQMVELTQGAPAGVLLSVLFAVIAILTNILSNNATAVLFTPIALGIADTIGADREAFIACVIFAANASFATPIGYQTNLLVMGPGRYRFSQYLTAGVPLVVIIWLTFSIAAPLYYGL